MERSELPHYGLLSALALFGWCAADVVRSGEALSLRSWILLLLLAAVLGGLHGVIWRLALRWVAYTSWLVQFFILTATGLTLSGSLARSLGAFGRLSGPYRNLALGVLAGCSVAAVAFVLLGMALLPTWRAPRGRALGLAPRFRWSLAALLAGIAVTCFYADPRYYPDEYPQAHAALRWASLWLAVAAIALTRFFGVRKHMRRPLLLTWFVCAGALPILAATWPRSVDELMQGSWSIQLVRATREALDFDRDGYSGLMGGGDCNDFDPKVHPGAREIPGNGIDDNCILGDAKPKPPVSALPKDASEPSPYDIILITVDSLRPDHVGFLNPEMGPKGRNTTPNIDAWAAQSAVTFEDVYATGGWTSISLASLMRGLYPRRLEWTRYYETYSHRLVREDQLPRARLSEQVLQMFPLAWNDPHPTLARLLRRRGMRTVAVVHDGFSRMLTRGIGVERDFDEYREVETETPTEQSDAGNVIIVERALAAVPKDQRLFLWVHFFGVHSVNEFHPGIQTYGSTQRDAYDHEVRYLDSLWPRLWNAIRSRGDKVVTILTSDHGEVFAEPIRMHGFSATEADIRVPLFVHMPGVGPKRVSQLASTVDLFPTLLSLTRTPAPAETDGLDLLPFIVGNAAARPRNLIAETWRYTADGEPIIDLIAALDGRRKLLLNSVDQTYRAFDVLQTPEARAPRDKPEVEALRRFLDQYVDETGGALNPRR